MIDGYCELPDNLVEILASHPTLELLHVKIDLTDFQYEERALKLSGILSIVLFFLTLPRVY